MMLCTRCGSRYESQASYCPHDGARLVPVEDAPDPLLGTMVLDQFRIEEPIGSGGMGTVYRAHQVTVGRDVAIKVLRPEYVGSPDVIRRFEREARIAIKLDHPNLVRVFLTSQLPDGRLYIVMEYLEGRSLADLVESEGLLSIERTLSILIKLCAGIHAVHSEGIVHRDIKPENVFLITRGDDEDFVKVVDFGIARMLEGGATAATQPGRVFGTANYISPEAAVGESIDPRSDVYSIGVLAYQLLCGQLPFDEADPSAMLIKHVREPAPDVRTLGQGARIPDSIAEVIMRSLTKDRRARHQSVTAFVESLAEAATEEGFVEDVQELLIGTMWSGGRSLASVLGARSTLSPVPPPQSTELPREDEELLSIAPDPFAPRPELVLPRHRARRLLLWTAAAVLVGALAIAAFVIRLAEPPTPAEVLVSPSEEARLVEYRQLLREARTALESGDFIGPPGKSVLELTARMLSLRPEAPEPGQLRAQAVKILASRGRAASERGDEEGARDLYAAIQVLDPANPGAAAALGGLVSPSKAQAQAQASSQIKKPLQSDKRKPSRTKAKVVSKKSEPVSPPPATDDGIDWTPPEFKP